MKNTIFTWNSKDKIWKALEVYNNGYISDQLRDEALDILLEEFSDQLSYDWTIDMEEHGYTDEEIEEYRGTSKEIERETEHLLNVLQPNWF